MSSARKLLVNGRPVRDKRGRSHWQVAVKSTAGAWTSRRVWAASEAEAIVEATKAAGLPIDGITWSQAAALWNEAHSVPGPAFRVERYRKSILAFARELVELVGDKRLDATTRQDWQRFLDSKTHGSGRTANNARSLREVAVWLRGRQDLGPLPFLEVPRVEEREGKARRAIPREQWPAYIAAAQEPLRFIVEFLFLTGWRAMEAAGLTEDRVTDGRISTILKGGSSWSIPVSADIEALLGRARAWKAAHGHQDRRQLFLNARGRPWSKDRLRARWKAHQRAAKLPAVYLVHEIRHSVCTYLGSLGLSPVQIASLTGHRSPSTLERYTHKTDHAAALASSALSFANENPTKISRANEGHARTRRDTEARKSGQNTSGSDTTRQAAARPCGSKESAGIGLKQ